jgi:hypothetical protein
MISLLVGLAGLMDSGAAAATRKWRHLTRSPVAWPEPPPIDDNQEPVAEEDFTDEDLGPPPVWPRLRPLSRRR